jgi:transcriptional regulator with XRE-family HTH domain
LEDRPPVKPYAQNVLGEELRKERLKARVTQEELAERARVSRNYVSLLELNEKSPTVSVLLRVCRALGVRASTIIARIERKLDKGGPR